MTQKETLDALMAEHDTTFAAEAGITLADKPAPLFRLLVLTALMSANIDSHLGLRTSRALSKAGFTTAAKLADASDDERWQVLADSKYLRKKQTAKQLGQLAQQLLDRYDGDLRTLGDEHDGDVDALRDDLQQFAGVGPVGADIFCREVQAVWQSPRPFADERVLRLAKARGLPDSAQRLAKLAGTNDLSRVGAALVLADMDERAGS